MSKKNKNKKNEKKMVIDPNEIKVRDELLMALINGVTKGGVQKDRKKEQDKKKCRKPVREDD